MTLLSIVPAVRHRSHLRSGIAELFQLAALPWRCGGKATAFGYYSNIDTDATKAVSVTPPATASTRLSIDPAAARQAAPRPAGAAALNSRYPLRERRRCPSRPSALRPTPSQEQPIYRRPEGGGDPHPASRTAGGGPALAPPLPTSSVPTGHRRRACAVGAMAAAGVRGVLWRRAAARLWVAPPGARAGEWGAGRHGSWGPGRRRGGGPWGRGSVWDSGAGL